LLLGISLLPVSLQGLLGVTPLAEPLLGLLAVARLPHSLLGLLGGVPRLAKSLLMRRSHYVSPSNGMSLPEPRAYPN
jgi:hypothetical protein